MPKSRTKATPAAREFLANATAKLRQEATTPRQPATQAQSQQSQPRKVHRLTNRWGWLISFSVLSEDYVRVERSYHGLTLDEYTMPRCEARQYWASLRRGGFVVQGEGL